MSLRVFVLGSRIWSLWALLKSLFWIWGHWCVWESVFQASQPWTFWRTMYRFVLWGVWIFKSHEETLPRWLESVSRIIGVRALWVTESLDMKSLWCLRVYVQILIVLILKAEGIGLRVSALWTVYGYMSQGVKFLNYLWVYVPSVWGPWHALTVCCCISLFMGGCTRVWVSELFECVYETMRSLICWECVSQDERFLICSWVYIPGC